MPDSSSLGRPTHLGQAEIEARQAPEGCPCFCHADGHPGATHALLEPALQAEEKGKDLAQGDFDNEASASSSVSRMLKSSELAGSSSPLLNFDPLSFLKRKATIPVPADAKQTSTNDNVKAFLQNREPTQLLDRPDQADWTSGIGPCMAINLMNQQELTGEAEDHPQVREPPMGIGVTRQQPVTFFLPSIGVNYANGGDDRVLMPFLEIYQVEDPEQLGVNGVVRHDHVRDDH